MNTHMNKQSQDDEKRVDGETRNTVEDTQGMATFIASQQQVIDEMTGTQRKPAVSRNDMEVREVQVVVHDPVAHRISYCGTTVLVETNHEDHDEGTFKVGDGFEVQTDCEVEDKNPKVGAGTCTVCVVGMTGKIISIEQGDWIVSLDDFRKHKRFWIKKDQLQHFKRIEDTDESFEDHHFAEGQWGSDGKTWIGGRGSGGNVSLHGMQHEVYRSAPIGPALWHHDVTRSAPSGPVFKREVFRSAPRGPIMGLGMRGEDVHMCRPKEVFRSAPSGPKMFSGSMERVSNDMCRPKETYRSAPSGPQMFSSSNQGHFRPLQNKEVYRSARVGPQMMSGDAVFRSASSQVAMPHGIALRPNAPKKFSRSGQLYDDVSQTTHSSSQSLPKTSTPERQDCLTVDQRQRWLDARKAALKRHEDALKRNEQRMSDEELKRVKPRLLEERKRLDAEQFEIDDDRKHIPQSVSRVKGNTGIMGS